MKDQLINRTLMPSDQPDNDTDGKIAELLDYVRKNYDPEDLFEDWQLSRWAESNGYIKIDNNKDY